MFRLMAPKGGAGFLLLIVVCAALANTTDGMRGSKYLFKGVAKKLMMKCWNKGVPVPDVTMLKALYKNSDVPTENQYDKFLSMFLHVLDSVTRYEGSSRPPPMDVSEKTNFETWTSRNLPTLVKLMRSSSDPSICYLRAFVAPAAWVTLTAQDENNMDENDYDAVKWAAEPNFQMKRVKLPSKVDVKSMKKMMDMLQKMYDLMSVYQRRQVSRWEKEQIAENNFNCTLKPPSRSKRMVRCKPSVQWLNEDTMSMMGPFLSYLKPNDVDASPKETLCQFFISARFNSTMNKAKMRRSLIKKFISKFRECFKGEDSQKHIDKLGVLACYVYDVPDLTPEELRNVLNQLEQCKNREIKKVKKRFVKYLISNPITAEFLPDYLKESVTLLSPWQLSKIPATKLMKIVTKLGSTVKWTRKQQRILVRKYLGGKKCRDVSPEDLEALKPFAEGLTRCLLRKMKAKDILSDTTGLKTATNQMKKGKLKAMLEGIGDMTVLDLLKLPGPLLRSIPLDKLKTVNDDSLDQADNEGWNKAQAAYLVRKMAVRKFRKLRSLIQGLTCKIINKVADRDVQEMVQGITENQKWVSKVQVRCAARKLFATLKKKRANYFKTITEDELDRIDTILLLQLPPKKVKELPDSVCTELLEKMENANVSKVPSRSPSRLAFAKRALSCLLQGKDLSELTEEDVSKLGPLLCELPPSKLELMAPDVLSSTLQEIAECKRIPKRNRKKLMELVIKTFGNPIDWSAETLESLLPLLDDYAITVLPNKGDVKDVIVFMISHLSNAPKALRKKAFQLTITNMTNAAHGNRPVSSNSVHEPIEAEIDDLGSDNVFWSREQLEKMSNDTFVATVETFGDIRDFNAEQLTVLRQKAVEAMGPVSQMTEDNIIQLGCITQGFSNLELENLPLSLDNVEELTDCGWTDPQIESVWKGVAKYNNLTAQQLGTTDIVSLNRFICGLSTEEIKQLNIDAFKDAEGSIDDIKCSSKALGRLKPLVVSVRGDPSTWTEAEVSESGNFIAGLNRKQLASLDPSVLPFLAMSSIPLIPPENVAAFSATQLENFGPDNAAMVTYQQRAALTDEQLKALERAETGSDEEPRNTVLGGGPPSLSVEGISAFMKPVLVFLMGVLLM